MYEPGTLRPPTDAEMDRRELPLEYLSVGHGVLCGLPDESGHVGYPAGECRAVYHVEVMRNVSIADLNRLCGDYGVPRQACVVPNGYEGELALDWTHVNLCAECREWFEGPLGAHQVGDVHRAIVSLANWRPTPGLYALDLDGLGPA